MVYLPLRACTVALTHYPPICLTKAVKSAAAQSGSEPPPCQIGLFPPPFPATMRKSSGLQALKSNSRSGETARHHSTESSFRFTRQAATPLLAVNRSPTWRRKPFASFSKAAVTRPAEMVFPSAARCNLTLNRLWSVGSSHDLMSAAAGGTLGGTAKSLCICGWMPNSRVFGAHAGNLTCCCLIMEQRKPVSESC